MSTAAAALFTYLYLDRQIERQYANRLALRAERERAWREKEQVLLEEGETQDDSDRTTLVHNPTVAPSLTHSASATTTDVGGPSDPPSALGTCPAHGEDACPERRLSTSAAGGESCPPPLPSAVPSPRLQGTLYLLLP